MVRKLDDAERATALASLPEWRHEPARDGITRVHGGGICTASSPQRFYSYRRDRVTGRQASLIWIK